MTTSSQDPRTPDGSGIDFKRLRRDRRARILAEMERGGIDVLVLGRESNARYVSGARRLSLSGTRPFGPGCVFVRATGQAHLISTWDDGIPPEIPHENLFGVTWNPMNYAEWISKIPGAATAKRVGVDGMSPSFARMLGGVFPTAQIVAAATALDAARRTQTPDELGCIARAVAIAEASLHAAIERLRPGAREVELAAAFLQQMTSFGVATPAFEGSFCVTPRRDPRLRRISSDAQVGDGDLVMMHGGVLYEGYEGSLARTWPCLNTAGATRAQRRLYERWRDVIDAMRAALRPGATGADLIAAYERTGEQLPPFPIARGVGLGYQPPVIGSSSGARAALLDGMTLALQAYVWSPDVGGYFGQEIAIVTGDGCELLTHLPHGPLAA